MIELETSRLRLLPFSWDDVNELALLGSSPATRGFLWDGPVDYETTASNLRQWMKEYELGLGHLAMIAKPGGELVGHCGLTERDGRIVLVYALSKEHWCKGLAPEACNTVLRYGFEVMEFEEIWTGTRAENSAWRGMMEKLGMTFREAEYSGDGEEVLYTISREEFLDVPPTSENPAPSAS